MIEPGCKAIIIGGICPENYGKIVTVGKFIGESMKCSDNDIWEVDKPILFKSTITDKIVGTHYLCSEKTMQRIDDHKTTEFKCRELETV